MRYRHPTSVIENDADVSATATLGCFVQACNFSSIGDDSVIEGLTIVPSNVRIQKRVRVGFGVCFLNPYATSNSTIIHDDVTIGSRAIIHDGVTIGRKAIIAPGAVVQSSIPTMAIVEGAPAKIVGYVGVNPMIPAKTEPGGQPNQPTSVHGVSLHKMPRVMDIRGNLTVGEFERGIPFPAKRYFMVFDVPSLETRGEHAHRQCHQFLICVRGSCAVVADDGKNRQEFLLDRPDVGLHLSPMVWGIQYKYSEGAILLVFASHYYDSDDYIRDYDEFKQLVVEPR